MMTETACLYLKNHPLFNQATEQMIHKAASLSTIKTVYRGECIEYGNGVFSKVFLLVNGKIKISELNEAYSNELIKDILIQPDLFGNLSLDYHCTNENEYAESISANTIVCIIHVFDLKKLFAEFPLLAMTYVNIVTQKLRRAECRHSNLVFFGAKARLLAFIRDWAINDGRKEGSKIILNNYLTHTDIASAIDTSRQSVSVLLNELRDSGVLSYNRKFIEINECIL